MALCGPGHRTLWTRATIIISSYQQGSSIGGRLARGAFWALVGTVISRGLTFLASIITARLLGIVHFGELGVIQSTITMFASIAGFSLGLMATKFVAELYIKDPERTGRIISLSNLFSWITGGVMTFVLFFFSHELAEHTLAAPHLSHQLRIASFLLLLGSVTGAQTGTLYGFEAFKTIAKISVVTGLAAFTATVLGTWFFGLEGAIWGAVASLVVTFVVNVIALRSLSLRHGIPQRNPERFRELGLIWKFSLPAMLGGVMVGPIIWITNAFVVNQPNGYTEMGLFNAANQLRQMILFLPATLASVALPMLSNLQGMDSLKGYRKLFWANLALSFASAMAIALPVALLSPWVMTRFGASFRAGSDVLILLCIVSVLTATLNGVGQSMASEGKMWMGFLLNLIWAVIMLSVGFLLRRQGAFGLGIAHLAAISVHLITVGIYVRGRLSRIEHLKPDLRQY